MKKVLAIDMGATSIRGVISFLSDGKIHLKEVMRLSHNIIEDKERKRWQFDQLLHAVSETIVENSDVDCIAIDTWGVDFGALDKEGNLLNHPVSYRDPKHEELFTEYRDKVDYTKVYEMTGNQLLPINTLFQLLSLRKYEPHVYQKMDRILMMPNLFNYFLTSECGTEETMLSTTQLYQLKDKELADDVFDLFDLKKDIFPPITYAGQYVGSTKNSKIAELQAYDIPVISVAAHDTASAILVTGEKDDSLFLSCGTWSLFGSPTHSPILTKEAMENDISNELGYDSKNLFFTNLTGLYLIEKVKMELEEKNQCSYTYDQITQEVEKITLAERIDTQDAIFAREDTNVYKELVKRFGQKENEFIYFAIIYHSLADQYKKYAKKLEKILHKTFSTIHVIGGGAKSSYLCQLIADRTGKKVKAGPFEATVLGNVLIQLQYLKEINHLEEGLELVRHSFPYREYEPK